MSGCGKILLRYNGLLPLHQLRALRVTYNKLPSYVNQKPQRAIILMFWKVVYNCVISSNSFVHKSLCLIPQFTFCCLKKKTLLQVINLIKLVAHERRNEEIDFVVFRDSGHASMLQTNYYDSSLLYWVIYIPTLNIPSLHRNKHFTYNSPIIRKVCS